MQANVASIKGTQVVQTDYASWLLLADHGSWTLSFVQRCQTCQLHGNKIHAPIVDLHSLFTPLQFYTWVFDLIDPIKQPFEATYGSLLLKRYTKWVEVVTLMWGNGTDIASFIRDSNICMLDIHKCILSNNDTPFVDSYVRESCECTGSIMSSQAFINPKGIARLMPLTRPY